MSFCPNCGTAAEPGQRFCGECGAKLSELPPEPVYTDDPRLKNDPVFRTSPEPAPGRKSEKVPELTLEPDLWGYGAAAAAAQAAAPAEPARPAAPAAAAEIPVEQREAPRYADVMRDIPYERSREAAPDNVPNDYTMSQAPAEEFSEKLPNDTLMLIWSIILTMTCSICGIVGLVKTVKSFKESDLSARYRLLSSARIWLIIGTALRVLPFLGALFG